MALRQIITLVMSKQGRFLDLSILLITNNANTFVSLEKKRQCYGTGRVECFLKSVSWYIIYTILFCLLRHLFANHMQNNVTQFNRAAVKEYGIYIKIF